MPAHVIAEARAAIESRPNLFPVLPQGWHAVEVFVRMSDQWRIAVGMGAVHYQGLDLSALPVVLAAVKPLVPDHLRQPLSVLLDQLRALAAGAKPVLNG